MSDVWVLYAIILEYKKYTQLRDNYRLREIGTIINKHIHIYFFSHCINNRWSFYIMYNCNVKGPTGTNYRMYIEVYRYIHHWNYTTVETLHYIERLIWISINSTLFNPQKKKVQLIPSTLSFFRWNPVT